MKSSERAQKLTHLFTIPSITVNVDESMSFYDYLWSEYETLSNLMKTKYKMNKDYLLEWSLVMIIIFCHCIPKRNFSFWGWVEAFQMTMLEIVILTCIYLMSKIPREWILKEEPKELDITTTTTNNDECEPLLTPIGDDVYITRFRRHRYPQFFKMYEHMITCFWVWPEIDLGTDIRDWKEKLKNQEREFLKLVFAFFAFGDGLVVDNLMKNFMHEVQDQDARFVYGVSGFFETIHATTYAMILDTLVNNEAELTRLENLFKTDTAFIELKEWCEEYMDPVKHSFAERVLAFGCFEGIIFSGAFCGIFWFKMKGLMPGVTFSNELISRDEGLHTDFACMMYNVLQNPLPYEKAMALIKSSMEVATIFITRIVPCNLLGINPTLMIQYLEFICNRYFHCFDAYKGLVEPFPNAVNPFTWMEMISLQGKTNFFERRVGEYSNAAMASSMNGSKGRINEDGTVEDDLDDNIFTTDADF